MEHMLCSEIADRAECRRVAYRITIFVAEALLLLTAFRFSCPIQLPDERADGTHNCGERGQMITARLKLSPKKDAPIISSYKVLAG